MTSSVHTEKCVDKAQEEAQCEDSKEDNFGEGWFGGAVVDKGHG